MRSFISFLAMVIIFQAARGRAELPSINSNARNISIREGTRLYPSSWFLAPDLKPDHYVADLVDGGPTRVTFITDVDSISFMIEEGMQEDFVIRWDGQTCLTRVTGKRIVPAAVFDQAYQDENRGKIAIEIPEVYELVNIALAITSYSEENEFRVHRESRYYSRVKEWFGEYSHHPFVASLDSALALSGGRYNSLRMNGNSFVFTEDGKIVRSKVYNRIDRNYIRDNALHPFQTQMQSFSDESQFRKFFKKNNKTYERFTKIFKKSAGVAEIRRWLNGNFPDVPQYDFYRIVYSPLNSYDMKFSCFESNGFSELQPHLGFPYWNKPKRFFWESDFNDLFYLSRGVFLESNMGYIILENEKYTERIAAATSNLSVWFGQADSLRPHRIFNEYMKRGLFSLYILDIVDEEAAPEMIARNESFMAKMDFQQFESFNRFLMELYTIKSPKTSVSDLYPEIIEWFEKHNQ